MSFSLRIALFVAMLALCVAPAAAGATSTSAAAHKAGSGKAKYGKGHGDKKGHGHSSSDASKTSRELRKEISSRRMLTHLRAFQQIADDTGGHRASGFEGYGASVQYVLTQLRAAGYTPRTQVFNFVTFQEIADPVLRQVAPAPGKEYTQSEFLTMNYSASGDTGVRSIVPVDLALSPNPAQRVSTSGCEAADFAGFPVDAIALMQRGTCPFALKATNAQAAGASGAIIFNSGTPGNEGVVAGTLGETAQDGQPAPPDVTIPVVGISYAEGDRLATQTAPTGQIIVTAESDRRTSANVLADTRSGDPDNVTIMGAHLDSVPEGPGINDNGSGSAFLLETAIRMAKEKIRTENRVRFAWWGAEESGLVGATRYVAAITDPEFAQIAANLNFDMLASPNHAKFVYDGDFSHTTPPATAPVVNPGAAYIEQRFVRFFDSQDQETEPTAFDGRSDYKPFQDNGIAAGGLFSGAEVAKSPAQVLKWGGTAGVAFDPNYHQAGDDIDNLDLDGYEDMADAGAHVMAVLAEDRNLRESLAGGASAASVKKARKAMRRSKARMAKLGAYSGDLLIR
jgi:Zn-dependent M28 family amino/carboxypeptidase